MWTEAEDAGAVVITFDGIDADKRDATELAAFTRDLAMPVRDDGHDSRLAGSPMAFDRRPTQSPTSAIRAIFYVLLGIATGYVALRAGIALAAAVGVSLEDAGQIVLVFLGLLAPVSYAVVRELRASHAKRQGLPHDRFTLRLDSAGLSVTGERSATRSFALDDIDGFAPGRRIGVRRPDGTTVQLPCVLSVSADHAALAARLDAALRNVRSAAGGYRGVRIAVEQPEDEMIPDEERPGRARELP
jgi:hypothetical protein